MAKMPKINEVRAAVLMDGWKIDRSYRSNEFEAYRKDTQGYMFIRKRDGSLRRGDSVNNSLKVDARIFVAIKTAFAGKGVRHVGQR